MSVLRGLRVFSLKRTASVRFQHVAPKRKPLDDLAGYFHYTKAIVASSSTLDTNFIKGSLRFQEPLDPIDLELAQKQHEKYVNHLRTLIGNVISVEPDTNFPDQVFVEDPVVVLDGIAVLTNMKPRSRAGEKWLMQEALERLNLEVVHLQDYHPGAYMDGGDVLFTGREILVGLSERTNKAGVEAIAKIFPHWPVSGIPVSLPVLHLKSMSSMAGIDTIAISDSRSGQIAWKEIERVAQHKYNRLVFPDNNGANCLFINGTVLHPPKEEYPQSYEVWQTLDCEKIELANSELAKADGSLTCNSVRIN